VFYHVAELYGNFVIDDKNAPDVNEPAPASSSLRQRSSASQDIFFDSQGLRPIWRLVLYIGVYKLLKFFLVLMMSALVEGPLLQLWLMLIAEAGLLIAALTPAFFLSRLEERPVGSYGLNFQHGFGKLFLTGVGWGAVAITSLMLIMDSVGVFNLGTLTLHGLRLWKFAVFWAGFFLIVAVYEEFLTRGYTQFTLCKEIGFWPAAIVLSIAFGVLHDNNPGETLPGLASAALIGLFFCLTLRRTGNLWFAVGFHAAWDWGESYLYSVPNSGELAPGRLLRSSLHGPRWLSGGSVGPEGSVLVFVVIICAWLIFDRVYPQVKYLQ
jgi:hypothetical protein